MDQKDRQTQFTTGDEIKVCLFYTYCKHFYLFEVTIWFLFLQNFLMYKNKLPSIYFLKLEAQLSSISINKNNIYDIYNTTDKKGKDKNWKTLKKLNLKNIVLLSYLFPVEQPIRFLGVKLVLIQVFVYVTSNKLSIFVTV